jgi:hypothetical protein
MGGRIRTYHICTYINAYMHTCIHTSTHTHTHTAQELAQTQVLERLKALLYMAKSAAERADHAKARGENLRRIQRDLRGLGVSGHVRWRKFSRVSI